MFPLHCRNWPCPQYQPATCRGQGGRCEWNDQTNRLPHRAFSDDRSHRVRWGRSSPVVGITVGRGRSHACGGAPHGGRPGNDERERPSRHLSGPRRRGGSTRRRVVQGRAVRRVDRGTEPVPPTAADRAVGRWRMPRSTGRVMPSCPAGPVYSAWSTSVVGTLDARQPGQSKATRHPLTDEHMFA
jgi:hypothetical protein